MKQLNISQVEAYVKNESKRRTRRKIVVVLSCLVLLITLIAMIVPAQALLKDDLTEAEQTKVDEVIALIDAMPSASEIDEAIAEYTYIHDYTGEENYRTETLTKVNEAYAAYSALSESMKSAVTNSAKLMELEPLWSASTLAEDDDDTNKGTIKPKLDGDYAYIGSLKVIERSTGGVAADFDLVEGPGNDTTETDDILRTFDTTTYKVAFQTKLRNEVQNNNIGGYHEGRVYYELILPVTPEEAVFEVGQMLWMRTFDGANYSPKDDEEIKCEEIINSKGEKIPAQIIRGSFLVSNDQKAVIGEGEQTLDIVVRAKAMSNGQELQPIFTMWLEYNDVGAVYEDENNLLHTNIVYGQDKECPKNDEEPNSTEQTISHGNEAATVVTEPIKISASPRYNIGIETGHYTINVTSGTYDFSTYSAWLDQGDRKGLFGDIPFMDAGIHTGRMVCFGLEISMYDTAKGLVGMEMPDENSFITFEIDLSTFVNSSTDTVWHDVTATHAPLVWSAGGNYQGWDQRAVKTGYTLAFNTAINNSSSNPTTPTAGTPNSTSCFNGGDWIFTYKPESPNKVFVQVSNFDINLQALPSNQGYGGLKYYDTQAVGEEYWKITNAVFSTGKIYVLQPFTSTDGKSPDLRETYDGGNTLLYAKINKMHIKSVGEDNREDGQYREISTMNMNIEDDIAQFTGLFSRPGDIRTLVSYDRPDGFSIEDPLTEGCVNTNLDWAFQGQTIRLCHLFEQMGAEGTERFVASDALLKFDDAFFEPTNVIINDNAKKDGKNYGTILWAAKPDGTGWDHKGLDPDDDGYDLEMREATPEDLVYYKSLAELKADSAVCVGVMIQRRDVYWVNSQMQFLIEGTVKKTAEPGQVYLITHASYAWKMKQFSEAVKEYFDVASVDALTDEQYCKYVKLEGILPDWTQQTRANYEEGLGVKYSDYTLPNVDRSHKSNATFKAAQKALYDANGLVSAGTNPRTVIDCCLVTPYATVVDKSVAQKVTLNGQISTKTEFALSDNQKTVDYVITPSAQRTMGTVEDTSGADLTTTVYIEDVIPKYLSVLYETFRWEGQHDTISYSQDAKFQNPGSVTGGLTAGEKNEQEQYFTFDVSTNTDGETVIRLTFHNVEISGNKLTNIGQIYYSCVIDDTVANGTILSNTAKIWSVEDRRAWVDKNQNIDTADIRVSKSSAMSLSKISDWLVAEQWDDLPFTMQVNNNGTEAWKTDAIIVETLPFNGIDHTSFNGRLVVKDFTADLKNNEGLNGFVFYYTTDASYAGIRAEELKDENFANTNVWTPLVISNAGVATLPSVDEQKEWGTYSDGTPTQITAIVAVGKLPASDTLEMHITLNLPDGKANDYLVNYLSQDNGLETYARTQIVSRSIEGLTWLDQNQNGIQDDVEIEDEVKKNHINGVKVSLLILNPQTKKYEPYCYPDTNEPVVIETGKKVSVLDQTTVSDYERGRYLFTDLPAGTFAVCFESGDTSKGGFNIAYFIASAVNVGKDDQIDSDGIPTYNDAGTELLKTQISDIKMKSARELTYGKVESKYNDSGFFYKLYELPITGGMGTTPIYVIGGMLIVIALGGYMFTKRKKSNH